MSESAVAKVRDADGTVHYASRYSRFVQEGLADGSLVDAEEAQVAAADATSSDDPDPGAVDRGSGHRKPRRRARDGDGHASVAEPEIDG